MRIFLLPNIHKNETVTHHLCYSSELGIEGEPTFHTKPRTKNDHILIYVTQGVFFCEQNEKQYRLYEGEFILLDLRIRHTYWFDCNIPSEIYWMHMNGGLTLHIIDCIAEITPLPLIGRDPAVLTALKTAVEMNIVSDAEPFAMSSHIMNTLTDLLEKQYRHKQMAEVPEKEYHFRSRFEEVIQSVGLRALTLDIICEQMRMSKYYFSHTFKQYYGISPMKYLLQERMAKAQNLLRHSSLKIASIAEECGFSSPEYFSGAFRRECGVSPEEFRNRSRT